MDEDAVLLHRAELRVHCYRLLGSLDDAEDLVQETFLRAWKHREAYEDDWHRRAGDAEEERVLRRYMDAVDRADLTALAALLAEDVRTDMPPYLEWFAGRDAVVRALELSWDPLSPGYVGRLATVATRANGGPAAGVYADGRPFAIVLPHVVDGLLASATAFHDPALFPRFGLPMSFPAADRCTGHG